MANTATMLNFKMGELANLQKLTQKTPGTVYVTTDERAMYLDVDVNTRIRLGDAIIVVNKVTELANVQPWQAGAMYYATEDDVLVIYTGTAFKLVNEKLINQVSTIATDLTNTNSSLNSLTETVGTIETKEGEPDVVTVGNWLSYLDSQTTSLKTETSAAKTDIDNAKNAIEELREEIAALTGGGSDSIKTLKDAIAALESTTATHTTQISDLTGKIGDVESEVEGLKAKDADLQKAIDDAKTRIGAIETDYLTSSDKDELLNNIAGVNTAVTEEVARAKAAEAAISEVANKAQADASQALTNAAAAQSTADKGVEDASNAQAAADKAQADVDALELTVSTLQTDIASTYATKEELGNETNVRAKADEELAARIKVFETGGANDVAAIKDSLNKVEEKVAANATNIAANANNIASNTENIAQNTADIQSNLNAINAITNHETVNNFSAMVQYVSDAIAANDAMHFKGTIGSTGATVTELPTEAEAGDTYKVVTSGTYAGNECKVGDLLIALIDNPTSSDWAYVPSGGEDSDNTVLSSGENSTDITLTNDANSAKGTISFVSASETLKVEGTKANEISINLY